MNPPRTLAILMLVALIAVSIWKPALSQGPADLAKVPNSVGLDWFYLPLYPLVDLWSRGAVWALLGGFTVMLAVMPWLPPFRRPKPAEVALEHCNGCGRCVEDCPYEAVRLVTRSDQRPFLQQAEVNSANCVSCGICVGSCPSSTPFRRTSGLKTGIDLPDFSLAQLRQLTESVAAGLSGPTRVLIFACKHGAAAGRRPDAVELPCVAMVPPSLIDYVISRSLANGVVIAGCAERACYNRLGVAWTEQRLAGHRDPYLRSRVPRARLTTIWASQTEQQFFVKMLSKFTATVAGLPPYRSRAVNVLAAPITGNATVAKSTREIVP